MNDATLNLASKSFESGLWQCRHSPTLIFEAGALKVYGASESKVTNANAAEFDLVLNLTGYRNFNGGGSIINGPRQWAFLKRFTEKPPVAELVFKWPDMGVLPVGRDFWIALHEGLERQGVKKLLIFCVGGHGRTGTAAGCLLTVAKEIHGGEAIKIVRQYCDKAIESKKQEDYVRSMTKRIQI